MKTLFYDNRHLLVLTLIVLCVGGVSAFFTLPRSEDPHINKRAAFIVTQFPGASPERVESQVTQPIETQLDELSEIRRVFSNSKSGVSVVIIELKGTVTDIDPVMSKIRDKISDAERMMPAGVLKPVFDENRGAEAYTSIVGLLPPEEMETHPGILRRKAENLAMRFRQIPGTDLVRIYGEKQEEISVTADADEIAALGLNAGTVSQFIKRSDSKLPSGVLRNDTRDVVMEVEGALDSLERVADIPLIQNTQKQTVHLGDVAQIEKRYRTPPREIVRIDGEYGVFVAARMEPGRRVDLWAKQANITLDAFESENQGGLRVVHVFDQNTYTQRRLHILANNLLAGAGVIVLIILLTMGWRSAIIVSSALPLSVCAVLFGFNILGVQIHQISIFGMIIALGLLIDNAIVMADEVYKRLQRGMPPRNAICDAVDHLWIPLLSSTMTTVIAFMPILLLGGNIGEFIASISIGVILALLVSYAISMTIVPALTGIFSKPVTGKQQHWWKSGIDSALLSNSLRFALHWSLRHPILSIALSMLLPIAGFMRFSELGNQFFPPADRDQFYLQMWLPSESSIEHTAAVAEQAEKEIRSFEHITGVHWLIGGSFPIVYYNVLMNSDDEYYYAHAFIETDSVQHVKPIIPKIQKHLNETIPQAMIVLRRFGQGPPVDAPIMVRIFGPNLDRLRILGESVRLVLNDMPDVLCSKSTLDGGELKYWIDADEDEARLAGLSLADIANQMQLNMEGATGGSIIEEIEELPVRVRFSQTMRGSLNEIETMKLVSSHSNRWIPLSSLGSIELKPDEGGIRHYKNQRCNIIKAYLPVNVLPPEVTHRFVDRLNASGFQLPPGYSMEIGGDAEEQSDAIAALFKYAPVLTILMIATLVLSFRSFFYAVVLGMVAVASVGLGALAIWFSGYPYGFNPLIGTAGLIGVALNDSIVALAALLADPNALQGNHESIVQQIMDTSRHIISTTLTTMGGFLPLLLFTGGEFWPPLAAVIAGGVAGATLLAFFFIPQAFLLAKSFRESRSR